MKKKMFFLLPAFVLLAALSACGKTEPLVLSASETMPATVSPESLALESGVPLSGRYEAVYTTGQGVKIIFDAAVGKAVGTADILRVESSGLTTEALGKMLAFFAGADGESFTEVSFDIGFPGKNGQEAHFGVQDQPENASRYVVSYSDYSFNGCYSEYAAYDAALAGESVPEWENVLGEAEACLAGLGIGDMELAFAEMGRRYSYDTNTAAGEYGSIKLFFTRTHEGMGMPFWDVNAWQNSRKKSSSGTSVRGPEFVTVEIDETGIVHFMYMNPIKVSGVVEENVALLTADEAVSLFLDAMETYPASVGEITISEILLGYQFRPAQENSTSNELVPCWVFVGTDPVWSEGFGLRTAQLVLSAVDGSIWE